MRTFFRYNMVIYLMANLNPDHPAYQELYACKTQLGNTNPNIHLTLLEIHVNQLTVNDTFLENLQKFANLAVTHPLHNAIFGFLGNIKIVPMNRILEEGRNAWFDWNHEPYSVPTNHNGFTVLGMENNFLSRMYTAVSTGQYPNWKGVFLQYDIFTRDVVNYLMDILGYGKKFTSYIDYEGSIHYTSLIPPTNIDDEIMVIPNYHHYYQWLPHFSLARSQEPILVTDYIEQLQSPECQITSELFLNLTDRQQTLPYESFTISVRQTPELERLFGIDPIVFNLDELWRH